MFEETFLPGLPADGRPNELRQIKFALPDPV
jgi:hypothetical protein